MAMSVLVNLQNNVKRIGDTQERLSSGKIISKASDDPGGAVTSLQLRSGLSAQKQYSRNADDGIGWLGLADATLTTISERVNRARDLTIQGMSTGTGSPESRAAIAAEIDGIREALVDLSNTKYLDRPLFGGTTADGAAFDDTGAYVGDTGAVLRTVGESTKVRVDVDGEAAFSTGATQLFTVLAEISTALTGDVTQLPVQLGNLDTAVNGLRNAQSSVGARYNQLTQMRQAADDRVIDLTQQLSNVEDIDLPKTITDLTLQQTAYQAALSATAKVIQPSLVDFLR
jgi:flagellar hook-associated protein 3 FlgL